MAKLHHSVVDVMYGLEWPTDGLARPHIIVKLENEHDYEVTINHPAPPPAAGWSHSLLSGFHMSVAEKVRALEICNCAVSFNDSVYNTMRKTSDFILLLAPGLDKGGEEVGVLDPDQHPRPALAVAFKNFQELERIRFGDNSSEVVSRGHEIVQELAEDYYLSEDESMESPTEDSPNPSIVGNLQLEGVPELQNLLKSFSK